VVSGGRIRLKPRRDTYPELHEGRAEKTDRLPRPEDRLL